MKLDWKHLIRGDFYKRYSIDSDAETEVLLRDERQRYYNKVSFTRKVERYLRDGRAVLLDPVEFPRYYRHREEQVPRSDLVNFESAILAACAILYKDYDLSKLVAKVTGLGHLDWIRVLSEIRNSYDGVFVMKQILTTIPELSLNEDDTRRMRLYRMRVGQLDHDLKINAVNHCYLTSPVVFIDRLTPSVSHAFRI